MSTKMNGGMKMISADGSRVLERNHPEIHALLLSKLKTATEVNVVSTGSRYSLIVRVSIGAGLFRDDLIGEDGQLMHRDERWSPATGKPITELILKFILVSSDVTQYEYESDKPNKSTMLQMGVINEYKQQRIAFDETNRHVPLCPDVVALISFPTREKFDEIFLKPQIYSTCPVITQLRTYFIMQFEPHVAMIVMESIPATYVPLKQLFQNRKINFGLIAQICAMCVVLFHMCRMVALDANWSNWLVDMMKPKPLRVKLIDYGMCLNPFDDVVINEIVNTYFETHPTEVEAYLKLMGANPDDSPSDVMNRAIKSVSVPIVPMESWIHKILVISMLIDGFFNMNHSTTKTTCQMKNVFNIVYDNACVSMSKMLQTLSLDLGTYLASQSQEKSKLMHEMLTNMEAYMTTYYGLRPRSGMDDAAAAPLMATGSSPLGGKKTSNTRKRNSSKRKRNKKRLIKSRKNKMYRK